MKLLIALELDPFEYQQNDYESPKGTFREKSREWNEFWTKSIADRGIENIKPIKEGSWLVDITELDDRTLKIILQKHLEDVDLTCVEAAELQAFSGGVVMKVKDVIYIEPQCCASFIDVDEWFDLPYIERYNKMWIGHPWVFYRYTDNNIVFSEYYEQNADEIETISAKISVNKDLYTEETKKIKQLLNDFEDKIKSVLQQMNHTTTDSDTITKFLIGEIYEM